MTAILETPTVTITADVCHQCDQRPATADGILCGPCRAEASRTITVRRRFTIPINSSDPSDQGTHYLHPDDMTATLCGIDAADTTPNTWTKAIASCFTCQRVARDRKVGP